MSGYYTGRQARGYNTRLRTFTERTLSEALVLVNVAALRGIPEREGRPPRVLDVACGTGILLQRLFELVPTCEAYGIDASADMLAQARAALRDSPRVHLEQFQVGAGNAATLPAVPYAPGTFDLITCTNALHNLPDPARTPLGFGRLLAPGGYLVLEDFARRAAPFP